MLSKLKAGWIMLRGEHKPRRNLRIWQDDIFLVSFPKSGNTWTRFLIANMVHPEANVGFENIHRLVPDPFATAKKDFDHMSRPRVIKSHECFEPRYPRVIYIVRDPRDVVLSQYHYHRKCKKIEDGYSMETFVDRFVAGDTCPHGSWGENVGTWLTARHHHPKFLLLKYEDMVDDACREMTRVSSFLGLNADAKRVAEAVERSSADRMRKLEKAQADNCGLTAETRKDLSFVRAAKSGGWQKDLSENLVAKIEDAWPNLMSFLGYKFVTRDGTAPAAEFSGLVSSGV